MTPELQSLIVELLNASNTASARPHPDECVRLARAQSRMIVYMERETGRTFEYEPTPMEQLHTFSVPEQPEDKPSPLWLDSQEAEDHAPRCKPL